MHPCSYSFWSSPLSHAQYRLVFACVTCALRHQVQMSVRATWRPEMVCVLVRLYSSILVVIRQSSILLIVLRCCSCCVLLHASHLHVSLLS